MNTEELSTSLAAEIAAKHQEALSAADKARRAVDGALNAAADTGTLIEKAKDQYQSRLQEWLRENVPSLTAEQAGVSYGIHRRRLKRQVFEADSAQLKLIGVIGDEAVGESGGNSSGQRADGGRWIKWKSHIVQEFRERDAIKPIEQWESYERKAWQDELRDVAVIFKRAGGVL